MRCSEAIVSRFGAVRIISRGDFEDEAGRTVFPVSSTVRNVILFANLPLKIAQDIDRNMDDGDISSGNFRASAKQDPVPLYAVAL